MTNVQTVSIKDTRDNLASLVDQVAIAKKQFVITKFGKPKAMLTPFKTRLTKPKKDRGGLPGFGMWADRKDMRDSGEWVAKMRQRWSIRHGSV